MQTQRDENQINSTKIEKTLHSDQCIVMHLKQVPSDSDMHAHKDNELGRERERKKKYADYCYRRTIVNQMMMQ